MSKLFYYYGSMANFSVVKDIYSKNIMARSKMTTEKFIEKAKKIHGNKYDYSTVEYKGCK